MAVAILAGLLLAGTAEARSRLERPGTVGFGGGGGYGWVTGPGRYGVEGNSGGNYFFSLKYMMHPRWALGAFFQHQNYSWEGPALPSLEAQGFTYESIIMNQFEAHLIRYFKRDADASSYLDLGLGLYRPELRGGEDTVSFPGENLVASLALGTEIFLREQWALDLSAKGTAYFGKGYTPQENTAVDDEDLDAIQGTDPYSFGLQLQVGILYYILK
jgi:hypothetical protein